MLKFFGLKFYVTCVSFLLSDAQSSHLTLPQSEKPEPAPADSKFNYATESNIPNESESPISSSPTTATLETPHFTSGFRLNPNENISPTPTPSSIFTTSIESNSITTPRSSMTLSPSGGSTWDLSSASSYASPEYQSIAPTSTFSSWFPQIRRMIKNSPSPSVGSTWDRTTSESVISTPYFSSKSISPTSCSETSSPDWASTPYPMKSSSISASTTDFTPKSSPSYSYIPPSSPAYGSP